MPKNSLKYHDKSIQQIKVSYYKSKSFDSPTYIVLILVLLHHLTIWTHHLLLLHHLCSILELLHLHLLLITQHVWVNLLLVKLLLHLLHVWIHLLLIHLIWIHLAHVLIV